MSSLSSRYLQGEYQQVWRALLFHGQGIAQSPISPDAVVIAYQTMERIKHNIASIIDALHTLDYHFHTTEIWNLPPSDTQQLLDYITQSVGPLPLSVRMWYEVIGSVCLLGTHPHLAFQVSSPLQSGQRPFLSDPLTIYPLSLLVRDLDEWSGGDRLDDETYFLALAPDADHKANLSGAEYGIIIPNDVADAPLLGTPYNATFIEYLRRAISYGGFPGLSLLDHNDPSFPHNELAILTKDVIPF